MQHQNNRRKELEEMVNKDEEKTKRTTIILEKEEREFIDSLIREGKEAGIKQLISKMLNVYRNMMIYDWRFPGEYYLGLSRIACVNVELLNIIIQRIPENERQEIGKRIGFALRVSMETTQNLQTFKMENWEIIFKRLQVQGFGDFSLKDRYILIKTPFLSYPQLWKGILEGLLDIELEMKTIAPPLVFEVKTKQTVIKQ